MGSKNDMVENVSIKAPNMKTGELWIKGTAPLVVHKFSEKAKRTIRDTQTTGPTVVSKKKRRDPKNFDELYEGARHISFDGWDGFPASAIRSACIDACRLVGFKMTLAKLSVFVEADGFDETEGTPLIRIIGAPRKLESMVRLANGSCDITVRPQWIEWGARLRIKYDADQFTASDVVNLVNRAGIQCGICEGRPSSKNSHGMGWGTFEISTQEEVEKIGSNLVKAAGKAVKK